MSALATELGAVIWPRFSRRYGPQELKDIAVAAIIDGRRNRYPPAHGLLDLRSATEHQQRHYGLDGSPDTRVVVTTGAGRHGCACAPSSRPVTK